MSRQVRGRVLGKRLMVTALTFLFFVVLLFATACEDLGTDTEEPSSTDASDITVLFGTWDGTYTPDAAWGENGSVEDPPFALGTPVSMHMELHPWDADSGEYGTVSAGGLSPASVTSLTRAGSLFTLIVITEAEGLNDLLGVFELTLDGDTLTGQDDRAPEVPSGWISSSGTVLLTRTAPWDGSATTETTATTAPDSAPDGGGDDDGGADDGGADDGADDGGDGGGDADGPDVEMIPEDAPPPDLVLGAGDNGGSSTIRVGERVVVHFEYLPGTQIADIFCQSTSSVILFNSGDSSAQDPATHYYYVFSATFDAVAPGTADVIARSERADGTLYQHWRYHFVVVE